MKQETINALRDSYISERLAEIDSEFLEFEEEMSTESDLETILTLVGKVSGWPNPHNSILLYVLGITDTFSTTQARADTIDGSPPDIDMDFDALDRWKAVQWVINRWGRENVAQIGTFQTFKPRGMIDDWHRVHEKPADVGVLKKLIPDDKYGKSAKLEDVVKNHPKFPISFPDFYNDAVKLESMVAKDGIHAAGIVISDFPVSDLIPIRTKTDKTDKYNSKKIIKWVTQYDMHDTEELGLIKFDFLGIENLSIIKESTRLIEKYHGKVIEPYDIPDGDEKTYNLLDHGLVTGVFQMETSGSARDLIARIKPRSIEQLSDISALNRPGPMQANLHNDYIDNKNNGFAPTDLPAPVAKILEGTFWTLVYQEQVMKLCTDLAGFTLLEADDVRRAMGKKKEKILRKWMTRFIDGCVNVSGLNRDYAEELWIVLAGAPGDPNSNGFADYCLAGNTKILTWTGEGKGWETTKISQLVKQETPAIVQTMLDEDQTYNHITQWHRKGSKDCRTYTFEDGSTVTCTPDHKFMTTNHEWVTIAEAEANRLELLKL